MNTIFLTGTVYNPSLVYLHDSVCVWVCTRTWASSCRVSGWATSRRPVLRDFIPPFPCSHTHTHTSTHTEPRCAFTKLWFRFIWRYAKQFQVMSNRNIIQQVSPFCTYSPYFEYKKRMIDLSGVFCLVMLKCFGQTLMLRMNNHCHKQA